MALRLILRVPRITPAELPRRYRRQPGMIPGGAAADYQMLSKLLRRMVVHPRSDAINEIEIWSCATTSLSSDDAPDGHASTARRPRVLLCLLCPRRPSPTSAPSPHDQSPLTNELLRK